MQLTNIKNSLKPGLYEVDKLIKESLHSDVELVQQIGIHIIQSGGKRLRPLLVLLSAAACGYTGPHQVTMATVIEFIHTATLLHDDVVDNSMLRRSNKTANNLWGNQAAVLVGDFLYSRAFQLMVQVNDSSVMRIVANATNTIAEGEVLQLLNQKNPQATEISYLNVIRRKTAKLFEAAAEIGAVLGKQPKHIQIAFAQYGLHIGTAYQLVDDALDYSANSATLGKSIGNDLAEGKPTLPLIYILQHGNQQQKDIVQQAILAPETANLAQMQQIILDSGSLEYTMKFAEREAMLAKQAIAELPSSMDMGYALDLANYVICRDH